MAKDAKAKSRITAQGQVSVPARVREALGLYAGSVLEWDTEGDVAKVRRVGTYTFADVHRTLFPKPPKPRSLEEMKEGIAKYVRGKHARRRH